MVLIDDLTEFRMWGSDLMMAETAPPESKITNWEIKRGNSKKKTCLFWLIFFTKKNLAFRQCLWMLWCCQNSNVVFRLLFTNWCWPTRVTDNLHSLIAAQFKLDLERSFVRFGGERGVLWSAEAMLLVRETDTIQYHIILPYNCNTTQHHTAAYNTRGGDLYLEPTCCHLLRSSGTLLWSLAALK